MSQLLSERPVNRHNAVTSHTFKLTPATLYGKAAILSNNNVRFSRELALVVLKPFQTCFHSVVFNNNFNIMAHFQFKI